MGSPGCSDDEDCPDLESSGGSEDKLTPFLTSNPSTGGILSILSQFQSFDQVRPPAIGQKNLAQIYDSQYQNYKVHTKTKPKMRTNTETKS